MTRGDGQTVLHLDNEPSFAQMPSHVPYEGVVRCDVRLGARDPARGPSDCGCSSRGIGESERCRQHGRQLPLESLGEGLHGRRYPEHGGGRPTDGQYELQCGQDRSTSPRHPGGLARQNPFRVAVPRTGPGWRDDRRKARRRACALRPRRWLASPSITFGWPSRATPCPVPGRRCSRRCPCLRTRSLPCLVATCHRTDPRAQCAHPTRERTDPSKSPASGQSNGPASRCTHSARHTRNAPPDANRVQPSGLSRCGRMRLAVTAGVVGARKGATRT